MKTILRVLPWVGAGIVIRLILPMAMNVIIFLTPEPGIANMLSVLVLVLLGRGLSLMFKSMDYITLCLGVCLGYWLTQGLDPLIFSGFFCAGVWEGRSEQLHPPHRRRGLGQ